MKHIIRIFIFNVFALWFVEEIYPGFAISGNWQITMFSGLILSLLVLFVKPLLKILFIPINILTFGLLSWSINVLVIYLLTVLVPEVMVKAWSFPGASFAGFIIPEMDINYFLSLIISSLFITILVNTFHNISES